MKTLIAALAIIFIANPVKAEILPISRFEVTTNEVGESFFELELNYGTNTSYQLQMVTDLVELDWAPLQPGIITDIDFPADGIIIYTLKISEIDNVSGTGASFFRIWVND